MEPEEHRTISSAEVWDEKEASANLEKAIEPPVTQQWAVTSMRVTETISLFWRDATTFPNSMIVNARVGAIYLYNQHKKTKAIGAIRQTLDEAKKHLLALEEDWDGEGAPAYQEETIEAAANFLYELVEKSEVLEATQVRILPASEGSIDLHWKSARFELLINFRPDGSVSYYGDDYYENSIQGKARPNPGFIAYWMDYTGE